MLQPEKPAPRQSCLAAELELRRECEMHRTRTLPTTYIPYHFLPAYSGLHHIHIDRLSVFTCRSAQAKELGTRPGWHWKFGIQVQFSNSLCCRGVADGLRSSHADARWFGS